MAGSSAAEFGLVVPVLFLILFSTIKFGIAFNNYLQLTNAVALGARQFAVERTLGTPYTDATTAIYNAAPGLTKANVTLTLSVNGSTCTKDANCATALTGALGGAAKVVGTYPCDLAIMGIDYAPNCKMTSQVKERVE